MKKIYYYIIACATIFNISNCKISKKIYNFSQDPIDVVIPCHEKDSVRIDLVIERVRKYVKNVNRVIIVSWRKFTDQAEWFDEKQYPFTKWTLALELFNHDEERAAVYINNPKTRIYWLFAQAVKLYAPLVIPNISSNVLILDADVILMKPISFIGKGGGGLYAVGTEHHRPYFAHAAKLIPGFKKVFPRYSGIAHHLLIQRPILEDMFEVIQAHHKVEPWKAMMRCINHNGLFRSAMADYELYFNFAFLKTDQVKVRKLSWKDVRGANIDINHYKNLDFIAWHRREAYLLTLGRRLFRAIKHTLL